MRRFEVGSFDERKQKGKESIYYISTGSLGSRPYTILKLVIVFLGGGGEKRSTKFDSFQRQKLEGVALLT